MVPWNECFEAAPWGDSKKAAGLDEGVQARGLEVRACFVVEAGEWAVVRTNAVATAKEAINGQFPFHRIEDFVIR